MWFIELPIDIPAAEVIMSVNVLTLNFIYDFYFITFSYPGHKVCYWKVIAAVNIWKHFPLESLG